MTNNTPTYSPRDIVYIRESAALGFLEAVTINTVVRTNDQWLYTIRVGVASPIAPPVYGDRKSLIHGSTIYFTEDELISHCDALELAEANAQRVLDKLKAQRAALCPSTE